MTLSKSSLSGFVGALGAILAFRASVAIPQIGTFIEKNPYIIMGAGVALIVFSATIAGWFIKT